MNKTNNKQQITKKKKQKQKQKQKSEEKKTTNTPTCAHQMKKQLAPGAVVEDEEQLLPRLERHVEADDERVLHVAQHVALGLRVLDLISLDDVVLPKHLHRVDVAGHLLPHQEDLRSNVPAHFIRQKRAKHSNVRCCHSSNL